MIEVRVMSKNKKKYGIDNTKKVQMTTGISILNP
jgi:hypothetical protein